MSKLINENEVYVVRAKTGVLRIFFSKEHAKAFVNNEPPSYNDYDILTYKYEDWGLPYNPLKTMKEV